MAEIPSSHCASRALQLAFEQLGGERRRAAAAGARWRWFAVRLGGRLGRIAGSRDGATGADMTRARRGR